MKFTPQTETQIADGKAERMKLLDPKVPYHFEVFTAVEKKSKSSGNDMFELTLNISSEFGVRQIRDWITVTQPEKLFEFCRSVGLLGKYYSGNLVAADLLDAEGQCRVAIEKGGQSPDGGNYPDRNKIAWYVAPESPQVKAAAAAKAQAEADDDVPF